MVSAFAAHQRLVLGQVKVADKSNEIVAIPKLLAMLAIEGAIVTVDAMGCQRDIARQIIDRKADYVLALKGNQGSLREDVEVFVAEQQAAGFADTTISRDRTVDGDHGRIETRTTTVIRDVAWLQQRHDWPELLVVDNGPELRGRALEAWAWRRGVKLFFIDPGKPAQTAYIESFNGRFRDECQNLHWFTSLGEARRIIEAWLIDDYEQRPHSSLSYRTPAEFAAMRACAGTVCCGNIMRTDQTIPRSRSTGQVSDRQQPAGLIDMPAPPRQATQRRTRVIAPNRNRISRAKPSELVWPVESRIRPVGNPSPES